MKKELGIFILLMVICVIMAIYDDNFLSANNLANLANRVGMFGIFSIGIGMIIITGGIDLSVGSVFALTGVILSMALREWFGGGIPWPLAVMLIIGITMVMGLVHGLLITKVNIQPFIVTLCGLLIYRGLARFVAHDAAWGFGRSEGFETLKQISSGNLFQQIQYTDVQGNILTKTAEGFMRNGELLPATVKALPETTFPGIPNTFIFLVIIAVIMWFVIHRSVFGRYLMAIGRNEEAARYSGIPTKLVITSTYVLAGVLTGISAILFAFYSNTITPSSHGNFYELYGIAAAVLGGCSLRGGEGSVIGVIIGTALLLVLQNLVNLLGIPSALNFAVMGAVVLIGVIADQIMQSRRAKRRLKQSAAASA